MMPLNPLQIGRNYLAGQQSADELQQNKLALQQQQRVNSVMADPNATPDAYARVGRSDISNSLMNSQRFTEDQQKQLATVMVQAAQYGLQSPQPKAFIEQNYPGLARLAGDQWAALDDNGVKAKLQEAIGHFGPMAGIGPSVPKTPGSYDEFALASKDPAYAAFLKERRGKGISMTTPDGSVIQIGGDGTPNYNATEFGKATRTDLEKAFVNSQGNAYALREQLSKYRDEFSTVGGKFKAGIASAKDLAGMELAPQQQQYLTDFSSWKADTNRLLSQYLNQLSGAAISPAEEARLKAGFPNADDGPTVYKSKAESTLKSFALAQARAAYLLSTPGVKLDSISLEGMSNIIAMEANKLADSLERGGMNAEAAKQKAIADTRARFGLGQ